MKDHTKYAVKIIKKADGKEALLLQLQSEYSTPTSWFVSWFGSTHGSCSWAMLQQLLPAIGSCRSPTKRQECCARQEMEHMLPKRGEQELTHAVLGACVHGAHGRCLCPADIVKEVAIMRLLADHPNTVQLHQVRPGSRSQVHSVCVPQAAAGQFGHSMMRFQRQCNSRDNRGQPKRAVKGVCKGVCLLRSMLCPAGAARCQKLLSGHGVLQR